MKYRTEQRTRTVLHGPAGQERPVSESYEVRIPKVPADWDARAIKFASALVMLLTLIAIVWSTVSIGALLHGVVGYAAASLFDLAWLVNVLLEWLARFDRRKRAFSRRLGWALLAVTMGAIGWHGWLSGGVAMAVIGACVSLFAKVLWMAIMAFVNRDLSDMDQQWVEGEISRANAQLALAAVRRMVARSEFRAGLELLAAEQTRNGLSDLTSPEPVRMVQETVLGDVTASRRRGVTSGGEPADIRPELDAAQLNGTVSAPSLRPEATDLRAPFQPPFPTSVPEPEEEPEPVETLARMSLAGAVRGLVDGGVQDPKVITAAASALVGREFKPESVAREIRAAKARTAKAETGPYL